MVHLFFRVSGIVLCIVVFRCFAVVVSYVRCALHCACGGILHFICYCILGVGALLLIDSGCGPALLPHTDPGEVLYACLYVSNVYYLWGTTA
jgi:hypothetical protein